MARKPAKQKAVDPTLLIYQVKISLRHTEPLIWRRVQIDDCSLDELHETYRERNLLRRSKPR